jgi:hypothetical protein
LLHCELDRVAEARRVFDRLAAQRFNDIPEDVTWLSAVVAAAGACAYLGDRDRAPVLYGLLTPYADHIASPPHFCLGSVSHYLGLLATTMGRFEDAEVHFAEAERSQAQMHAPTWTARTRLEWARMLLTRGRERDAERAHGLLNDALATARELGLGAVEGHAAALLSDQPTWR